MATASFYTSPVRAWMDVGQWVWWDVVSSSSFPFLSQWRRIERSTPVSRWSSWLRMLGINKFFNLVWEKHIPREFVKVRKFVFSKPFCPASSSVVAEKSAGTKLMSALHCSLYMSVWAFTACASQTWTSLVITINVTLCWKGQKDSVNL